MKRIHELDRKELLALTDEEVAAFIDRECAEEGVALLPVLPEAPDPPKVHEDLAVYSVSAWYFAEREVAEKVADFLNEQPRLKTAYVKGNYDWNGPQTVEPELDPIEVSTNRFWTRQYYALHQVAMDSFLARKKKWDEAKTEYDAIVKARKSSEDHVRSLVDDAWIEERRNEEIRSTYERYTQLAEGNSITARRFLINAGRWTEETIDEVLGVGTLSLTEAPETEQ